MTMNEEEGVYGSVQMLDCYNFIIIEENSESTTCDVVTFIYRSILCHTASTNAKYKKTMKNMCMK